MTLQLTREGFSRSDCHHNSGPFVPRLVLSLRKTNRCRRFNLFDEMFRRDPRETTECFERISLRGLLNILHNSSSAMLALLNN